MINAELLTYSLIYLFGTFISAISQVMLKKAAQKIYPTRLKEYLNPLVITAYTIFFVATLCSIYAYKVVPLSLGPILECTGYIYVTIFGVCLFGEKVGIKKIFALFLIILGLIIYSCSVG